jgi:hypothetical protein
MMGARALIDSQWALGVGRQVPSLLVRQHREV